MTCRELVAFLVDYLGGTLPADQRERFEAHLGECPDCVGYLRTYDATVKLGRAACLDPDEALPADVPEDLVRAILAARRGGL